MLLFHYLAHCSLEALAVLVPQGADFELCKPNPKQHANNRFLNPSYWKIMLKDIVLKTFATANIRLPCEFLHCTPFLYLCLYFVFLRKLFTESDNLNDWYALLNTVSQSHYGKCRAWKRVRNPNNVDVADMASDFFRPCKLRVFPPTGMRMMAPPSSFIPFHMWSAIRFSCFGPCSTDESYQRA